MKPSFIFSSSTLACSLWPTRAGAVAIALWCLARLALGIASEPMGVVYDDLCLAMRNGLETQHVLQGRPSPRILFIGASRMIHVSPTGVAQAAGIPSSELGFYGTLGQDFLRTAAFLKRHPELIRNVELLAMDVLPMQLDETYLDPLNNPEFLRYASLRDRWTIASPFQRTAALVQIAVPVTAYRTNLYGWRHGMREWLTPDEIIATRTTQPRHGSIARDFAISGERNQETRLQLSWNPIISRVQLDALDEIRAMLPETCRVVIFTLPQPTTWHDVMKENPAIDSYCVRFAEEMAAQGRDGWTFRAIDDGESVGLPDDTFIDYTHFTPEGGKRVTEIVGEVIRDNL